MPNKRKFFECQVIGQLSRPTLLKFPLKKDIIYFYNINKEQMVNRYGKRGVSNTEILLQTQKLVKNIWMRADFNLLSDQRISAKIKDLIEKYKMICDKKKRNRCSELELKNFNFVLEEIFDISKCSCDCDQICICDCGLIPDQCAFLLDQRSNRLLNTKCNNIRNCSK